MAKSDTDAPPFRASFLKIERAKKHIKELEQLAADFLGGDPVQTTAEEAAGPDGSMGIVIQMKVSPVPEEMSAVVGDIIHNLRTSLDLMASELCRLNQKSDKGVHFPFSDEAGSLDEAIKRWHFQRAGDDAIKLLKELKPYRGGNEALRAIHDLDIQDKHQSLIPGAMSAASPIIQVRDENGPLEKMRIVGDPNKASEVKLLCPAKSALANQPLIPTLHSLVQAATDIVESFKALSAPSGDAPIGRDSNILNEDGAA